MPVRLSDAALRDRLLGAWLGRAAGCLLGKPVEGWSRQAIRTLLERTGEYPLRQYIAYPDVPTAVQDGALRLGATWCSAWRSAPGSGSGARSTAWCATTTWTTR